MSRLLVVPRRAETVRFIPKLQTENSQEIKCISSKLHFPYHKEILDFEGKYSLCFSMDCMKDGFISPTSSPPTPPSPLPISVGPGNQKYFFSPSPSSSPPFSPPVSSHTSAENLPLLPGKLASLDVQARSTFSLDQPHPDKSESRSSCLRDLLLWFLQRLCDCCEK